MIDTDEYNFPHNLLLTDKQVASFRKAFANNTTKDIKLSILISTNKQKFPGQFCMRMVINVRSRGTHSRGTQENYQLGKYHNKYLQNIGVWPNNT